MDKVFYRVATMNNLLIPQDSVARHMSESHLIFQELFSGNPCKYAILMTARKGKKNIITYN